ncbi:MAG: hypothetical protein HOC81_01190, partial [Candidatus Marinimicrobia bacterium]|nr:hypothetical protein [Candidatus Neomarinimicrobiota bacterium]
MTEENPSQAQPEQPEIPKKPRVKPKKDPRAKLYKPETPLILASSPHFHTRDTVPRIMWNVILALVPATVLAVVYFQWAAVGIIL